MTNAAHFMDRVLDPLADLLGPDAAQSIINLQIDPELQKRVEVLAILANEGELSQEERDEYLSYIESAELLSIFKLKARRQFKDSGGQGWTRQQNP